MRMHHIISMFPITINIGSMINMITIPSKCMIVLSVSVLIGRVIMRCMLHY